MVKGEVNEMNLQIDEVHTWILCWCNDRTFLWCIIRILWTNSVTVTATYVNGVSGSKFCDLWTSHAFGKDNHQERKCFTVWQSSGQGEPDAIESKAGSLRCNRQITLPKCTIFRYRICRFTITCKKQNKTKHGNILKYFTYLSIQLLGLKRRCHTDFFLL